VKIKRKIGQRIRMIRKKIGLTQEELAEKVGVTGKFIGAVERGDNFASFPTLEAIATALGCSVGNFFQTDYLDETDAELTGQLAKRIKKLSTSEKRKILFFLDTLLQ